MSDTMELTWTGTDGSVWDLLQGPVRVSMAGLKGLGSPDVDHQVSVTAGKDGQRLRSLRRKARTVFLPIRFKDAGATDVLGIQAAWWRSLTIGEYGTLQITYADGSTRSLTCRFEDDGGAGLKVNPFVVFVDTIGLTLTADDPFWYGDPEDVSYSLDVSNVSFFGGGDASAASGTQFGPPFVLSGASGSQSYTVSNPGDVDAWPMWTITGPFASASVGVGSAVITTPAIDAGRVLQIDTDPFAQSAKLDGVRQSFQSFPAINFAPVPRGMDRQLTIAATGNGTIAARIWPRFERAL